MRRNPSKTQRKRWIETENILWEKGWKKSEVSRETGEEIVWRMAGARKGEEKGLERE